MFLIWFGLVLLLLTAFKSRRKQMKIFESLGIPGPKPNILFGNAIEIAKHGSNQMFPKWTRKFGPIVGFFLGGRPQVLISDVDLIRQVLITDFHVFTDRQIVVPGGIHPQNQMKNTVPWSKGNDWKRIRSQFIPLLSSSKVRKLEDVIMPFILNMRSKIDQELKFDGEMNIAPILQDASFLIGVKSLTGINVSTNLLSYEMKSLYKAIQSNLQRSVLAMAMVLFPSLTFIAYPLRVWWESLRLKMKWSTEGVCLNATKEIIRLRKETKIESNDLLQSMLSLENDAGMEMLSSDDMTYQRWTKSRTFNFSEDDIAANAFLLLFAAFETTSSTLQFTISNLVRNQDVQNELRSELQNQIRLNDGLENLAAISKVPLLQYVIKETLRMFPPASPGTSRVAQEDYELKGHHVPKGTGIFISVMSVHYDPQLWPEPYKFQPRRFEGEYNQLAFLPFGAGPRVCIGIHFALVELQLILAHLILRYRFEPTAQTSERIEITESNITIYPKNGVNCKVVKIE
ncbi:Cytochrome P450 3A24 [Pseudolycoriella hygida]|uniref:Cytochrome P450 3A24 n=1 Tax=Pseudolycoriella hygida TaxID=35572 RepID=A0A9Q0N1P9_9DIPT|nr:Cytochrome P450 3A24 [Pseudolycoriella hygida]